VGYLESGNVSKCGVIGGGVFGLGTPVGSGTGGLVGVNVAGKIDQCYSTAWVEAEWCCGGLVGQNLDDGSVTNCYAAGSATINAVCDPNSSWKLGGLIGANAGTVWNCYASSHISILPDTSVVPDSNDCLGDAGGLIGSNTATATSLPYGPVMRNYSNADLFHGPAVGFGDVPPEGALPVSYHELTRKSTFQSWDFFSIWSFLEGEPPHLRWQYRPVPFADPSLKSEVGKALGVTDPNVLDMLELVTLDAQGLSITDVNGLETAVNLQRLYLNDNEIVNVSALRGLVQLRELGLRNNAISDITDLTGLTNLTVLNLQGNNITDVSALEPAALFRLEVLWLNDNDIEDVTPLTELSQINLIRLVLSGNPTGWQVLNGNILSRGGRVLFLN